MYRQPEMIGLASFLRYGLSLGFEVCPSGFSIAAPTQTLAASGAICNKFSFQKFLTSGADIVAIFVSGLAENYQISHCHGHAIGKQQMKKGRKISQSARLRLLSDCRYCACAFFRLFLLGYGFAGFCDTCIGRDGSLQHFFTSFHA